MTGIEAALAVFLLVGEEVVDVRRLTELIVAVIAVGYGSDVAEIFQMSALIELPRIDAIVCMDCSVSL